MKIACPLLLMPFVLLAGCSSQDSGVAQRPDPTQSRTAQEQIDKIQNDSKIPGGLKKIQTDSLRRQSGIRP